MVIVFGESWNEFLENYQSCLQISCAQLKYYRESLYQNVFFFFQGDYLITTCEDSTADKTNITMVITILILTQ